MSAGRACVCVGRVRTAWYILAYRCNHSAFNGSKWTRSAYSAIRCARCGSVWRTKAAYVDTLPRSPPRPIEAQE